MQRESDTHKHACARLVGLFSDADTFGESPHPSLLALVHVPRLAEQDPCFVVALPQIALLDRSLKQERGLCQRPVVLKQSLRLLECGARLVRAVQVWVVLFCDD